MEALINHNLTLAHHNRAQRSSLYTRALTHTRRRLKRNTGGGRPTLWIAKRTEASASLRGNVHWLGEVSEHDYLANLVGAEFLWHPALIDNGTFSVIEAASL